MKNASNASKDVMGKVLRVQVRFEQIKIWARNFLKFIDIFLSKKSEIKKNVSKISSKTLKVMEEHYLTFRI